jgi:hypothetical protein
MMSSSLASQPVISLATLRTAFDALFNEAEPTRQANALRAAIGALVAEEASGNACHTRQAGAARPSSALPIVSWETLRPRLREIVSCSPAGRHEVAKALGLAPSTLARMLTSHRPWQRYPRPSSSLARRA